jgi:transcriptional regulator with XRE-family HTH domain
MAAEGRATALGRLISEVQAANKWSYADIAENARVGGRRLSKSRVESLRNARLPSISINAIESLAAGLHVSPDRVAQAAIESMGYTLATEAVTAQSAIASDPALSEPVRRVLLAALAAAHEQFGGRPDLRAAGGSARVQRKAADDEAMDI